MNPLNPLHLRLQELATASVLLVACDFDGTLAPIVDDPGEARPDPEALRHLRSLAALSQTHAAIISGRALSALSQLVCAPDDAPSPSVGNRNGNRRPARSRLAAAGLPLGPDDVFLVGSHGCEIHADFQSQLPAAAGELLVQLERDLVDIAGRFTGLRLEKKPASIAVHYRGLADEDTRNATAEVLEGPARRPGVFLRTGKKVIELAVVEMSKGRALQTLRYRLAAQAVLFVGDDQTDEEAFAAMAPPDLSVKVGPGETMAAHRVSGVEEVREFLGVLLQTRDRYLAQFTSAPINRHSLLSDHRSAAVVNPAGDVVWMCMPRIDSSGLFADLLGGPCAGVFSVRPPGEAAPIGQEYLEDSFVLRTRWPGFEVVDYLDCTGGRPFRRAGRTDLIRVLSGRGRVEVKFAPRLEFGRMITRLIVHDDGLEVDGSLDPIVLRSRGVDWRLVDEGQHQFAVAEIELADEPVVLELRYGTGNLDAAPTPETDRRDLTIRFWRNWVQTLALPPRRPDLVRRSALVLRALAHGPTGAIAAAATTSLPEHLGGVRNWDYRFCWPRDAAMSCASLVRLGATGQAMKFLDWLLGVLDNGPSPECLSPVYTVAGGRLMPEAEIGELSGYRASRPVRVGNLAAQQVQLDVFGPIVDLVALLGERGAALSSEHWRLVELMVSAVEHRWREPDHGIWEDRRSRQHHVHSKVMCWWTVQRALAVGQYVGRRRPHWTALRDAIAHDVFEHGWKPSRGAFTATYDEDHADAAALWVGLSGMIGQDDPRFRGTVDLVDRELRDGPTVYRYRFDDGLAGLEGGFHLCTTWLIESLARTGRFAEAESLFDQFVSLVGPTGLMSEEYDPRQAVALGNFPQAYSHLGLINAALALNASGGSRDDSTAA